MWVKNKYKSIVMTEKKGTRSKMLKQRVKQKTKNLENENKNVYFVYV